MTFKYNTKFKTPYDTPHMQKFLDIIYKKENGTAFAEYFNITLFLMSTFINQMMDVRMLSEIEQRKCYNNLPQSLREILKSYEDSIEDAYGQMEKQYLIDETMQEAKEMFSPESAKLLMEIPVQVIKDTDKMLRYLHDKIKHPYSSCILDEYCERLQEAYWSNEKNIERFIKSLESKSPSSENVVDHSQPSSKINDNSKK